jgi:hypothetical protein
MIREFARIRDRGPSVTRHYIGGQIAKRAVLVILDQSPSGTFLFRYDATGDFVGDTWHANVEDARAQAAFEYDSDLAPWMAVPADQRDLEVFAQGLASESPISSDG